MTHAVNSEPTKRLHVFEKYLTVWVALDIDVDVDVRIPYGHPVEEILRVASQDEDDTLIVMGSQGRGFLAQVFLGSVSHHVVRIAPVPILLVPAAR